MSYKAILFDMDGTLLPMDNDVFTKGYFKELAKKLCPLGIEAEKLISAVWAGTKAMVKNDGKNLNAEVFWNTFSNVTNTEAELFRTESDMFYTNEFAAAQKYTGDNPLAIDAVRLAREKGLKVVCASNPIFPLNGQLMRLSWVKLMPEDFDHITSYESESFCKPNPKYYTSICKKINVDPSDCLMIGNDEEEDMYAASSAGMDCYLVTGYEIKSKEHPWNGESGKFEQLIEKIKSI
ncbi:MAG: HAD family hydrolase [Porcipelethomonas sp.]